MSAAMRDAFRFPMGILPSWGHGILPAFQRRAEAAVFFSDPPGNPQGIDFTQA